MDELKKLLCSRRGHKSHLSKILLSVDTILDRLTASPNATLEDSDTILLSEHCKQLRLKADTFTDLDERIIQRTDDEEKLEAAVFESADLQAMLSEKIAFISHTLQKVARTGTQLESDLSATNTTQHSTDVEDEIPELMSIETNSVVEPSVQLVESHSQIVHDHPSHDPPSLGSIAHIRNNSSLPATLATPHHVPPEPPPHSQEPTRLPAVTLGVHSATRLPKLDIPIFTGEPLEWQSFWDCFEAAIDTNPSLTGVQKLSYLRAQLRGEATRAIAGFPLTNLNYHHSVSILKERYGQPHKIISSHVQALLELPKPINKLTSLRLFHDTVESHVRCLHSLGKSPESLETLLVPMILTKLPEDTKKHMARDHPNSEWTVEELQTAILKEIKVFEIGQQTTTSPSQQQAVPTASFYTAAMNRKSRKAGGGKLTCAYCNGNHAANGCDIYKDTPARLEAIKQKRLCYNCLGRHRVSQCNSNNRCRKCNGKHHTSICTDANKVSDSSNHTANSVQPPTNNTTTLTTLTPSQLTRSATCLLKTAIATIVGTDIQTEANVLFDEGSQRSFITVNLAKELAVEPHKSEHISLSSFGAARPLYKMMDTVLIHVKTLTGELVPLSALVVPTIATPINTPLEVNALQLPYLRGLTLAHPITAAENFEISLLVGADFYWELVGDHIIRGEGPTAMSAKLGYLLSGPLLTPSNSSVLVNMLHVTTGHEEEECNLQKFWQVEDTAITPEEDSSQKFLKSYCASHIWRQDDGTYCAGFPWKESHPPLPDNFIVCQKRTRSLAYRLSQSPGLLQVYDKILKEQLDRGFIELVTEPNKKGAVHYIPHHPVKKDSVTTPVRIVYDCSCRQSNALPSLNDCLITGPHFLVDLCTILLRFRTHQFGLSTDIEKAFLNITLKESDRDFTRFLWLTNPLDPSSAFVTYRFRRILFGAVSSPFILFATLHHHLHLYDTPLSHKIRSNLYVDNIVTGCETESQAVQFFQEARFMMCNAGFNLRAWASNSESLTRKALEDRVGSKLQLTNILGLQWNTRTDHLSLTFKSANTENKLFITKREVLKEASKLFDPLGITSPVSVRSKLFMQKLWQLHVAWDEPLDAVIKDEWTAIMNDIQQLHKLTINRRFFQSVFNPETATLHVFADASTRAYGAVAFLTSESEVTHVMAKNRVAPQKNLTLPKLELLAAVVASRIARFIIDTLNLQVKPTYFWGDSQIVLHWLDSTKPLPQFISNRVREIKNAVPDAIWNYCPTVDNPADLLTRGVSYQFLSSPNNLWWKGPAWITTPDSWPKWQPQPIANLHATATTITETSPQPMSSQDVGLHQVITLTNYSSLNRLLAVTAYTFRYVNNLHKSRPKFTGPLTAEELKTAHTRWIRNCQERTYPKELASAQPKPGRPTPSTPPLVRQLRLFLDEAGVLRCGGRIHNAPLSKLARFPYLLPQNNHLTELIVYNTHVRLSHAGVGSTLAALRQSFWIPTGRQYVRKLLRRCNTCRKHGGKPYAVPDSAPLPKIRVQEVPPFSITGVDFTGALYVKQASGDEGKAYICLFTCATSRAVHLEVVCDLSTATFLMAFRRFAARRSLPQVIMSDNATTYTSAAQELTDSLNSAEIRSVLGREDIVWKFIPKKAPWFGGYWERLIGLTKSSIKKTLGRAHITLLTLQTIVVEIEALLNDRPLTYVSDDISDLEPLTPAHILHGRRLTRLPHEGTLADELHDPSYCGAEQVRRDARTQTSLLEHFTARWKHEYLTSLREFHRPFRRGGQEINVGDVVLVHDNSPRVNWKLAVVESLVEGNDGFVCSATVRTAHRVTNRPVAKLYPLELTTERSDKTETSVAQTEESSGQLDAKVTDSRPQRDATQRARQRLAEWIGTIRGAPEDVEDS